MLELWFEFQMTWDVYYLVYRHIILISSSKMKFLFQTTAIHRRVSQTNITQGLIHLLINLNTYIFIILLLAGLVMQSLTKHQTETFCSRVLPIFREWNHVFFIWWNKLYIKHSILLLHIMLRACLQCVTNQLTLFHILTSVWYENKSIFVNRP